MQEVDYGFSCQSQVHEKPARQEVSKEEAIGEEQVS
jgi:hypothetical protein